MDRGRSNLELSLNTMDDIKCKLCGETLRVSRVFNTYTKQKGWLFPEYEDYSIEETQYKCPNAIANMSYPGGHDIYYKQY